ncbi:MAG: CDP-glucose 4,6-dehydratase [Eubacteriales bacterium]
MPNMDLSFYRGKRVLITGHTGFKGTWLSAILVKAGARVFGYSLGPPTVPSLFELIGIEKKITSTLSDIRNLESLSQAFNLAQPEIVFHLAAQPIVRDSYKEPVYTYETNVMGTVNILECIRQSNCVKSFINVTTDKVYKNNELEKGYIEDDYLDGFDPYSNSKSCSELVTHCYKNSFLHDKGIAVSTARAGNVIGGGDFANDRIIPDCVKAALDKKNIIVRNPYSTRPYQHVLEPLFVYLLIAKMQYEDEKYANYYNIGPNDIDCISTGSLVEIFCKKWGQKMSWEDKFDGGPHEAKFLKLDCSLLKSTFGWEPRWNIEKAIEKTVELCKLYSNGKLIENCMNNQIDEYIGGN